MSIEIVEANQNEKTTIADVAMANTRQSRDETEEAPEVEPCGPLLEVAEVLLSDEALLVSEALLVNEVAAAEDTTGVESDARPVLESRPAVAAVVITKVALVVAVIETDVVDKVPGLAPAKAGAGGPPLHRPGCGGAFWAAGGILPPLWALWMTLAKTAAILAYPLSTGCSPSLYRSAAVRAFDRSAMTTLVPLACRGAKAPGKA